MNDTWLKFKIWTKLILIGLVLIFIAVFIGKNYSQSATVWLFTSHEMSVLELLSITFLAGVGSTLLARPIYHTLGQISQLRKPRAQAPPPAQSAPAIPATESKP